jgi:hypothetical protein
VRLLKAIGYFWYDFIVGDDWKIAVYVIIALAVVSALVVDGRMGDAAICVIGTTLLAAFFALGVLYDGRKAPR